MSATPSRRYLRSGWRRKDRRHRAWLHPLHLSAAGISGPLPDIAWFDPALPVARQTQTVTRDFPPSPQRADSAYFTAPLSDQNIIIGRLRNSDSKNYSRPSPPGPFHRRLRADGTFWPLRPEPTRGFTPRPRPGLSPPGAFQRLWARPEPSSARTPLIFFLMIFKGSIDHIQQMPAGGGRRIFRRLAGLPGRFPDKPPAH